MWEIPPTFKLVELYPHSQCSNNTSTTNECLFISLTSLSQAHGSHTKRSSMFKAYTTRFWTSQDCWPDCHSNVWPKPWALALVGRKSCCTSLGNLISEGLSPTFTLAQFHGKLELFISCLCPPKQSCVCDKCQHERECNPTRIKLHWAKNSFFFSNTQDCVIILRRKMSELNST